MLLWKERHEDCQQDVLSSAAVMDLLDQVSGQ